MFDFFKKKENGETTGSKDNLLDKYLSIKKDINYLESKYDDFILKSLEDDFSSYKDNTDINFPRTVENVGCWSMKDMVYNEIKLSKIGDNNKSVKIECRYSFDNNVIDCRSVCLKINYNSITLSTAKFKDILTKYIMYWKIKEIDNVIKDKKELFQVMVDVIGKDIKRDLIIDSILSNE